MDRGRGKTRRQALRAPPAQEWPVPGAGPRKEGRDRAHPGQARTGADQAGDAVLGQRPRGQVPQERGRSAAEAQAQGIGTGHDGGEEPQGIPDQGTAPPPTTGPGTRPCVGRVSPPAALRLRGRLSPPSAPPTASPSVRHDDGPVLAVSRIPPSHVRGERGISPAPGGRRRRSLRRSPTASGSARWRGESSAVGGPARRSSGFGATQRVSPEILRLIGGLGRVTLRCAAM
mmetsp:Transcript_29262/g.68791  ORF Transcript_29262/g.68791 Transcript_29262/m.68791 type:complete len:230 (+) Transcript_29262:1681-2370(+)